MKENPFSRSKPRLRQFFHFYPLLNGQHFHVVLPAKLRAGTFWMSKSFFEGVGSFFLFYVAPTMGVLAKIGCEVGGLNFN